MFATPWREKRIYIYEIILSSGALVTGSATPALLSILMYDLKQCRWSTFKGEDSRMKWIDENEERRGENCTKIMELCLDHVRWAGSVNHLTVSTATVQQISNSRRNAFDLIKKNWNEIDNIIVG